jgi:dinuclear metal center YbgI/SA1388 family protein
VADVVAAMDALYDPALAEPWDAIGLVCGDPEAPVRKLLFAIDPVAVVAEEAIASGCQLIVCHHPLFLRGVHGVPATNPKGRLVHRLITAGVGLFVAHTNADVARPGVSDALADAMGLADVVPLSERAVPADKLVTFVPPADVDRVVDALAAAGAGVIGEYERCAYLGEGTGTFQPGPAARPTIGTPGVIEVVPETRLEMVLPRRLRAQVVAVLRAAHPYEEPAFDVYPLAEAGAGAGLGRIGTLAAPRRLADFAAEVARRLPDTVGGVRATGDRLVQRVAVCGGSGGDLAFDAAQAGADVFVTADLRHHPASEAADAIALVDAAHWATEWPWLAQASKRLSDRLEASGVTVETAVSSQVTDPWTVRAAGRET